MENSFWFCMCVLSLHAVRVSGISHLRKGPSTPAILKYFHPPDDEPNFHETEEDCRDPCVLNVTLLRKRREETERRCCRKLQPDCSEKENSRYRSIDGSCNNILNPDWGMAKTCHRRFLPHAYGDGVSSPRISCLHEQLPNARAVSNLVHRANRPGRQVDVTLHFMEWGQLFSHDVSAAATEPLPERGPGSCCEPYPRTDEQCFAVNVPYDDDFYPGKRPCLSFPRTLKCPLCKGGVRQTLNNATSYFDLSVVYGSSEETLKSLRSYANGKLRVQYVRGAGALPPPVEEMNRSKSHNSSQKCFLAGDERINQNPLISSLQTILFRQHNNLAWQLRKLNPQWDDERLFEEARRINIAEAQAITYREYLKILLGPEITGNPEFQLDVLSGRRFTTYDDRVDASVFDEFAAAAHRFGHTMIPNILLEKDPLNGSNSRVHMKYSFSCPFGFYSGQMDRIALGMAIENPKRRSVTLNSEVRNYLYDLRDEKLFLGSDLATTSIVRGQEHGLPGYTLYLKKFFNYDVQSFCDLKGLIPKNTIEKMKIYRSVHDIGLYTGVLAENLLPGGLIGPTGAAIIATQFWNLKFGDRYYFEHGRVPGSFRIDQLVEIRNKASLARIICETTKISRIQPKVFFPASESNKPVPCSKLPKLDLSYWKEQGSSGDERNS